MRPYVQRLERNEYRDRPKPPPKGRWRRARDNVRWLFGFGPDYTGGRHGFDGWLRTSMTDLRIGLKDWELICMLLAAFKSAKHRGLVPIFTLLYRIAHGRAKQTVDPNDAQTQAESPAGLALVPLAVCGKDGPTGDGSLHKRGHRSGPREFLLETQATLRKRAQEQKSGPDQTRGRIGRLEIATEHFVTRLIFEDELAQGSGAAEEKQSVAAEHAEQRVVGVLYLKGKNLYHAHRLPEKPASLEQRAVFVKGTGEVILASATEPNWKLSRLSAATIRQALALTFMTATRYAC
jgi:hypothetical protein